MCEPTVGVTRRAVLRAWWLVILQVIIFLGAIAYFLIAGLLYFEFYEDLAHTAEVGIHLRTDTLQYVQEVLGISTAHCATTSGQIPAFGSRFATADSTAAPLTFTPACSGVDESLQVATAFNLANEARLPTARIVYQTLRVPDASPSTVSQLGDLGFRTIPYGSGTTAVRVSGSMMALDERFITLDEALTVMLEGITTSAAGTTGSGIEAFSGKEDAFAFKLVDASGAVVQRCLRQGALASNLTALSSMASAELEASVFVPCQAAATVPSSSRPLLTLDALFASAGVSGGLSATDSAITSQIISAASTSTPNATIPYHLAGVSIDVEVVYDNLPDYSIGLTTKPLVIAAQAAITGGRRASWIADARAPVPTYEAIPQAAHLSLRQGVTVASCTSLDWSSDAAAVSQCITDAGGASNAFNTSLTAGQVHTLTETVGAVIRTVASGRIVRFNYTALASLAVQAITKYLAVMAAVVVVTLACWPSANQTVFTEVDYDSTAAKDGSAEAAGAEGDAKADPKADSKAAPEDAFEDDMAKQEAARQAAEAARSKGLEGGGVDDEQVQELSLRVVDLQKSVTQMKSLVGVIGGAKTGLLHSMLNKIGELEKRVTRLVDLAPTEVRKLGIEFIRREAGKAARDAVYTALTGGASSQDAGDGSAGEAAEAAQPSS